MPADTSTTADRIQFVQAVGGGAPITFGNSIASLANCLINMPPTTTYLLGLNDPQHSLKGQHASPTAWRPGVRRFEFHEKDHHT